ncbi:MAG: type II toxin-antitoxin system VapC family toxin [Gammaproteobacteria bacterium]|nr:type II toxin-antitoxin system VapC family toxin [Gammaproteobacteria bacterium]MYA37623.1 type II toxin-antitoxin system VapC family toxin [Gammaproteobacteria bacterium]MYA66394.1 type II toxin-antitoxin system VapC family toxin [Gammaproteobacteria bacterium]MYH47622.1 type II toxin-antitoxin system VapC family toxin [Gammaproteobacteria bacterium]MYH85414.1 type II toxin-antitoxin system VapC family toxin [Gammaproteobacteria bacterium]
MILVDTNVVSEPLRENPEPRVAEWLDAQALETLYLSVITVAELRFGIHALPKGRRRERLHDHLERRVLPMFAGRMLIFDLPASQAYAELMATARSTGRAVSVSDGYIAATAAANAMIVATRDTAPFEAAGLKTIDPWTA